MKIVLRESGGLGNQLFQYAALRYYARRYHAEMHIAVDPAWNALSYGYPRPCLLQHFMIPAKMEVRSLSDRIIFSDKPWLKRASAPFRKALNIQVFNEPVPEQYRFARELPLRHGLRRLYLGGYFQSHSMVEEMRDELRLDLTFRQPPHGKTLEVMEQMQRCRTPVSLHVRRGDATLAVEGKVVLTPEYYSQAMALMKDRLIDPTFFVFSDDMRYVTENLILDRRTVLVHHNDTFTSHEDLRLMASCRHHILANSTFSWWGAWLNPHPDKMVIAPRHWYLGMDKYYPHLFPPEWILNDFGSAARLAG